MERERLTPNEVEEYLARIHYKGPIEATIEALSELQRCHMLSVPFENLSVFGKEKIILSKDWLFDKVVRRHRGGFCYELNTLYALLLDYFGFRYTLCAGAVFDSRAGGEGMPFDHMILMVNIDNDDLWMTDVGFADSYLTPLHFTTLDPQERQSGIYRIRKKGEEYLYEAKNAKIITEGFQEFGREGESGSDDEKWASRCKFDLIPRTREDFKDMLLYHQTHEDSPFTHGRICTMAKPWGRITLAGNKLVTSTYLGDNKVRKETKELVGGEEEIVKELEEKFGIRKESCLYPETAERGIEWSTGNETSRILGI